MFSSKRLIALCVSAAALAIPASAQATGTLPAPGDQIQVVDQTATNVSSAESNATAEQIAPTNIGGVQVTVTGDNTNEQSNDNTAVAASDSNASSEQTADQSGSGSGDQVQVVGQDADNSSSAESNATAKQEVPLNVGCVQVSVKSDNTCSQSNDNTAVAASDSNGSSQQTAYQGGSGGDQVQVVGQDANNASSAESNATAKQIAPLNMGCVQVSVKGDNSCSQSNSNTAVAYSDSSASSEQTGYQGGSGSGDQTQVVGQDATNVSSAESNAKAKQIAPTNVGGVQFTLLGDNTNRQSNNNTALAYSDSNASSEQTAYQGGSGSGDQTQVVDQDATNVSNAESNAKAKQVAPLNVGGLQFTLVGDNTNEQSNNNTAIALSKSSASSKQIVSQTGGTQPSYEQQSCSEPRYEPSGGDQVQIVDQDATNVSNAESNAKAKQIAPLNVGGLQFTLVGDNTNEQSNNNTAIALSKSSASSKQIVSQTGGTQPSYEQQSCSEPRYEPSGGDQVQIVDQDATNVSNAESNAKAKQIAPLNVGGLQFTLVGDNTNEQSNNNTAIALSKSSASSKQIVSQTGGTQPSYEQQPCSEPRYEPSGGDQVQIVDQDATNVSNAESNAKAKQIAPLNVGGLQFTLVGDNTNEQSNNNTAIALSKSSASSKQIVSQTGGTQPSYEQQPCSEPRYEPSGGDQVQIVDQDATNVSNAESNAKAKQIAPLNVGGLQFTLVGDNTNEQSNNNTAIALSKSSASSKQIVSQTGGTQPSYEQQPCYEPRYEPSGGDQVQIVDQDATNVSNAESNAKAKQIAPLNVGGLQFTLVGDNTNEQSNNNTAIALSKSSASSKQIVSQQRA